METEYYKYSWIFDTVYDELEPVGCIGRGVHYSILSAGGVDAAVDSLHRFAVVWDEDHDLRIITVMEEMYRKGLMHPVYFIGERKGNLSVILRPEFYADKRYLEKVERIAGDDDLLFDVWGFSAGWYDKTRREIHTDPCTIIQDSTYVTETYLRNIDNLWDLGLKI